MPPTFYFTHLIGRILFQISIAVISYILDRCAYRIGVRWIFAITFFTVSNGRLALVLAFVADWILNIENTCLFFTLTIFVTLSARPLIFRTTDEPTTELQDGWNRTGLPTLPLFVLTSTLLHCRNGTVSFIRTMITQIYLFFQHTYDSFQSMTWARSGFLCVCCLLVIPAGLTYTKIRMQVLKPCRALGRLFFEFIVNYQNLSPLMGSSLFAIPIAPVWLQRNNLDQSSELMKKKAYIHFPLESTQIRLLYLLPRGASGQIRCSLIPFSLDELPPYEAMSYTWGKKDMVRDISIDGQTFFTTQNVFDLLSDRSPVIIPRLLWIDSICINQDDLDEKTHQVRLMKDIYRLATKVIIWLGHSPNAHLAKQLLSELNHSMKTYMPSERELYDKYIHEKRSPRWLALSDLFSHPYFNRVWVVQEVAVSTKTVVLYGGQLLEWDVLVFVVGRLIVAHDFNILLEHTKEDGVKRHSLLTALHAIIMNQIRTAVQQGQLWDMNTILKSCVTLQATDPRDKIFAFCGIAADGDDSLLRPDYKKSIQQVYTNAGRYIFHGPDSVGKALHTAGIGWIRKVEGLPSWVPDWSIVGREFLGDRARSSNYRASGNIYQSRNLQPSNEKLAVEAFLVDEAQHMGAVYMRPEVDPETGYFHPNTTFEEWFREARRMVHLISKEPYHNGQPLVEAYWRTLIGDIPIALQGSSAYKRPAPAEFGEHYQFIYKHMLDPSPLVSHVVPEVEVLQATRWLTSAQACCGSRRFCISRRNYMALVPQNTMPGDIIAIIAGGQTPFIIRRHRVDAEGNQTYLLVGECYAHGMMDGEMIGQSSLHSIILE